MSYCHFYPLKDEDLPLETIDAVRFYRHELNRDAKLLVVLGRDHKNNLYKIINDANTGKILDERRLKCSQPNEAIMNAMTKVFGILPWFVYDMLPSQRKKRREYDSVVEFVKKENAKEFTAQV
ncbi:MAG: hypothetical protein V1645_04860 [archaeon]